MEIIRIPKGATIAHLRLSRGWNDNIQYSFTIQSTVSGFAENGEYQTVELAEKAARSQAEQRQAACLIIEDNT